MGKNNIAVIGGGNLYFLSSERDVSITAPTSGSIVSSPLKVKWREKPETMATIFVDDKKTLLTEENSAEFEVKEGEHKVSVYLFDRYGKGVYDTVHVTVKKNYSSVTLLTVFFIFTLIVLLSPNLKRLVKVKGNA